MSSESLCFVHAADLHLERSLYGIAEIPRRLREVLIDAPYRAAERVFDATVNQQADFLVLAGDVVDPARCGPRAIAFLFKQFERLEENGIAVYWLGGKVDQPDRWTHLLTLPANVFAFGSTSEVFTHQRDGYPIANLFSQTHSTAPPADGHQIIVGYAPNQPSSLERANVDYVALGGQHRHQVLSQSPHVQYAGSPQGRCPGETGAHGCTVVRLDANGTLQTQRIDCDAVRWHSKSITVPPQATRDDLEIKLGERMLNLLADSGDRPLLVTWTLSGTGGAADPKVSHELTTWLRQEFSDGDPAAWTVSVESAPAYDWPEAWQEEDTILGDYLRAIRDLETAGEDALDFESMLPTQHRNGELAALFSPHGAHRDLDRTRILQDAAALGVSLLRGE